MFSPLTSLSESKRIDAVHTGSSPNTLHLTSAFLVHFSSLILDKRRVTDSMKWMMLPICNDPCFDPLPLHISVVNWTLFVFNWTLFILGEQEPILLLVEFSWELQLLDLVCKRLCSKDQLLRYTPWITYTGGFLQKIKRGKGKGGARQMHGFDSDV